MATPRKEKKVEKRRASSPAALRVDLVVDSAWWARVPKLKRRLAQAAAETARHLPAALRFPAEATLLLTTDARVRVLNHDFRGMDKPTNVLSFPQYEADILPKTGKKQAPLALGDIAIGYQITAKEAKESNKLFIDHVTHLTIHGLLHLFGYDHIKDKDAEIMEKLETKIMLALGLPDPYKVNQDPPPPLTGHPRPSQRRKS